MLELLKPIGKKKNARDLDPLEAREAARMIVSGEASDVQIAAFLMAQRIKGESPDEFLAMTQALRDASQPVRPARPVSLEIGGPFDGRKSSFATGIAVALILASSGERVALSGTDTLPPKHGVTMRDMLLALGLSSRHLPDAAAAARHAEASLDALGIAYLHLEDLCPPLARLRPIREQIGLRTMLNTVEKLIDVTGSQAALTGVFHGNVMEPVSQLQRALGYRKGLVIQGMEGSCEAHLGRRSHLSWLDGQEIRTESLEPSALGFEPPAAEVAELKAADQAQRTMAVLQGERGPDRDRVLLDAALLMRLLTGNALCESLVLVRDVLGSREPLRKLALWREQGLSHL